MDSDKDLKHTNFRPGTYWKDGNIWRSDIERKAKLPGRACMVMETVSKTWETTGWDITQNISWMQHPNTEEVSKDLLRISLIHNRTLCRSPIPTSLQNYGAFLYPEILFWHISEIYKHQLMRPRDAMKDWASWNVASRNVSAAVAP